MKNLSFGEELPPDWLSNMLLIFSHTDLKGQRPGQHLRRPLASLLLESLCGVTAHPHPVLTY